MGSRRDPCHLGFAARWVTKFVVDRAEIRPGALRKARLESSVTIRAGRFRP